MRRQRPPIWDAAPGFLCVPCVWPLLFLYYGNQFATAVIISCGIEPVGYGVFVCTFVVDMEVQFQYFRTSTASVRPNVTGGVPEWLKGTGCKPVGYAYVGSNPTPSTSAHEGDVVAGRL